MYFTAFCWKAQDLYSGYKLGIYYVPGTKLLSISMEDAKMNRTQLRLQGAYNHVGDVKYYKQL